MTSFAAGEDVWIRRLGNLRNTIRQEMVHRQVAAHVSDGMTVLDVGCGQGTQAIRLGRLGCDVTGIEPSADLRALCAESALAEGVAIELIAGSIERLDDLIGDRRFDLVCSHGLLMYLPDRTGAISTLARRVLPDGLLSLTVRNTHALAMRPGLRRQWSAALAALETRRYVNELGVEARADRLEDVVGDLDAVGMELAGWFGVRIFNDAVPVDMDVPVDEDLDALLDAEDRAGRIDPYRWMASQLHILARSRRS